MHRFWVVAGVDAVRVFWVVLSRIAGPFKGPLLSYMDVPGQAANIAFMAVSESHHYAATLCLLPHFVGFTTSQSLVSQVYPTLVARGGWSLVFRALQGTTLAGALVMFVNLLKDAAKPSQRFDAHLRSSVTRQLP